MAGFDASEARVGLAMPDPSARTIVQGWLESAGHEVVAAAAARSLGPLERFDVVCVDVEDPSAYEVDASGTTLLRFLGDEGGASAETDPAYEGLERPLLPGPLFSALRRAVERSRLLRRCEALERELAGGRAPRGLIGRSESMQEIERQIERVRDSDIAVAVFGRSGTGKEVVARAIHRAGRRAGRPFVAINCAALPQAMHEAELFGYERNAAGETSQPGRIEQARGGTLFLDEVADLSALTQASLVRALQERSTRRVGGAEEIPVDVRLISASQRDLEAEVRAGRFREDLYARLVMYPLRLPSLRERRADIPELVAHFLSAHASDVRSAPTRVAPAALAALEAYAWPGNVRELENVVHRAMLTADGDVIDLPHLPPEIAAHAPRPVSAGEIVPMKELERRAIQAALTATEGSVDRAAKLLGMGRATLYRRLAKYDDLRGE